MKKRIKLTDKELAIGMWVYIYLYIESFDIESENYTDIVALKRKWLEAHNLVSYTVSYFYKWKHDCYLCARFHGRNCRGCPLEQCAEGSLYEAVTEYYHSKKDRRWALKCAREILNIIQEAEEVEDEEEN